MHRWTTLALLALVPAASLAAQTPATPAAAPLSLSLDMALQIARANSPTYRQAMSNADPAKWGVRNAYGSLLPSFGIGGGISYTGGGSANLGQGFITQTSPQLGSNYNIGFNYNLSAASLLAPGQSKAAKRATDAEITASETALVSDVSTQYLVVKQSDAQVDVQTQQVARNDIFLTLANAKYKVGQGTLLEVKQAEVSLGQAKVELLRRQQTANEAKLELYRRMGVSAPAALNMVSLTDSFPVTEFSPSVDTLLDLAAAHNPDLRALREREKAAHLAYKAAKGDFLPSLQASAGWSGFTQQFTNKDLLRSQALAGAQGGAASCSFQNAIINGLNYPGGLPPILQNALVTDCLAANGLNAAGTALDPTIEQRILDDNAKWPFHFTSQPFFAQLSISLPIFSGFSTRLRVSQAHQQEISLNEQVRGRALQLEADVKGRYLRIQTTYEAIPVQQSNVAAAREQLKLAQDRYRLGSGNALEIADAQNGVQLAEGDYINAVYAYQQAIVALEAAVGHSLR